MIYIITYFIRKINLERSDTMPGTYLHHPTVQGNRGNEFVYNTTTSNWVIVDTAADFTIAMDDLYFMREETKEATIEVTNNGSIAANGITLTIQINSKFTYVLNTMKGGIGDVVPEVERFEGGGLFIQFPESFEIGPGETVNLRFQITANS